MVRALPNNHPSASFRDAAIAILRLSRTRGREECDGLGHLFEAEDTCDERCILILDLLGSAGTPEAQVVMRRLLSLAVARRESRMFATFVSRLGFVERPDVPTLRFLMNVYAESRHEQHEVYAACAYTLGAATGRAQVWGLVEPATRAAEVLRQDLLTTTNPHEKGALVTALGNAGLDHDIAIIIRFVTDEDASVRNAAVLALRKMHTVEARAVLLAIVGGSDLDLAESALSALFGQSLTEQEIGRLAHLVLSGRTSLALDSRILRLIVTQKLTVPSLSAPNNTGFGPTEIEDAIHLLLSRVEEQAARASAPPPMREEYIYEEQVDESGTYVKMEPGAVDAAIAAAARRSETPMPSMRPSIAPSSLFPASSSSAPSSVAPREATSHGRSASEALRLCIARQRSSRPPAPAAPATPSDSPRESQAPGPKRAASAYAIAQPIVPLLRIG